MKLHSNPHRSRSILAGLLALTLMFSMLPTAFAAQQNSYHDPANTGCRHPVARMSWMLIVL